MYFDSYASALKEAGTRLGFGPIAPSEDGRAVLDFGDVYVSLRLDTETGLLTLTCTVADLPEDCPKEALEMLLENQFFFRKTHGATLAISRAYHCILAHVNLFMDILDADKLTNAVENLVETAQQTRDELEKILSADQSPADGQDAGDRISGDTLFV